jgi:NTP pyrophosphatase (non-canonical NTP hydrolase)
MNFEEYQKFADTTAIYPNKGHNYVYVTLGLAGEAGEVAEKIKKVIRDKGGVIDEATKEELTKEIGDVLWYCAQLSTELGIQLTSAAEKNLEKLKSRHDRNKIHGDGDNR